MFTVEEVMGMSQIIGGQASESINAYIEDVEQELDFASQTDDEQGFSLSGKPRKFIEHI